MSISYKQIYNHHIWYYWLTRTSLYYLAPTQQIQYGTVTLQVAEGVIEDIQVRFVNENGESTDETGKPVSGRTQKYIITREMQKM